MRTILSAIFVSTMFLGSPSGAFAAGCYIQASSEEDQIAKDTKPNKMTMKSAPLIVPMTGATSVVDIELMKAD